MVIAQRALLCLAASALLASAGCKLIAPYSQAKGQGVDPDGSVPIADAALDGADSDWGLQADGGNEGVVIEDAPLDSPPALDGALDASVNSDGGVMDTVDPPVDQAIWTNLPPCASGASMSDTRANAYSTLTWNTGSNSWDYTDTGLYNQLKFGRKNNARAWLVVHFQVTSPSSVVPPFEQAGIAIRPASDGTYDTLDVCVEETLGATAIDESTTVPALLCRRWPQTNKELIITTRSRSTGVLTPDVAPLIQEIVDKHHGGAYPPKMDLQFWIGAAVETGPDSLIPVTNIFEATGTKLELRAWWCQ